MIIYIALLQGVNVGKHKRIAMVDLKQIVIDLGGTDPTTVANSGNVVFSHPGRDTEKLRSPLETAISKHVGMPVPVILRTGKEMRQVVERNPYPQVSDPKQLHVEFLLAEIDNPLAGIAFGNDHLTASGHEIYLHLPNRMSGLTYDARSLGKRLGSHHTSRNWNTITKLADIASAMR